MLVLQGQGSQSATDQAPPDQAPPDQAPPDQGPPDQGPPDQAPPLDDGVGTLRAGWGAWVIATYPNDPLTGEPVALAVLDGESAQGERLSIGCADGSNFLSVRWNQNLGDAASALDVEVRVDGDAIADMPWEITSDEDASILREEEAANIAASLYGGTELALGTMARDTEQISVTFDITGIEEVVPLVQEDCGW
jgi:hypothetical protein